MRSDGIVVTLPLHDYNLSYAFETIQGSGSFSTWLSCFTSVASSLPNVNSLLAHPVLLRDLSVQRLVRLAQNGDHLFLGKPPLRHDFIFCVGSHSLKLRPVQKFHCRSHSSCQSLPSPDGAAIGLRRLSGYVYSVSERAPLVSPVVSLRSPASETFAKRFQCADCVDPSHFRSVRAKCGRCRMHRLP